MKGLNNFKNDKQMDIVIINVMCKTSRTIGSILECILSSTCSILQNFNEGQLTWSRNKNILPIIGCNTIITNCIMMTSKFGHYVQSAVVALRESNGFADVIGPVEFWEEKFLICWLEARYQSNEITKKTRGN